MTVLANAVLGGTICSSLTILASMSFYCHFVSISNSSVYLSSDTLLKSEPRIEYRSVKIPVKLTAVRLQ